MSTTVQGDEILVDTSAIDVRLRPASQMRVELDKEALEEYAVNLDRMPPVKLMFDEPSNTYWVIDGAHTITAAWLAKRKEVLAIVQEGTYLDAWKLASRSNDEHGVRITNEDKEHRVKEALGLPAMADWPQEKIADWCGVSQRFVSTHDKRVQSTQNSSKLGAHRIGKDGKYRLPPTRPAERKLPSIPMLKEERKPDPPPKTRISLNAIREDESEQATVNEPAESVTQNTSDPTPDAAEAEARREKQAKVEAYRQAAERWEDHIQAALNILSSLERRGGVKALIEPWGREEREHFAGRFRQLIEYYAVIITQIEETI